MSTHKKEAIALISPFLHCVTMGNGTPHTNIIETETQPQEKKTKKRQP